ncbi:MAG: hypothetical protein ABR913_05910 [Sedimentisphaerales bacterium]|jgi:hypothetical protein
MSNNGPKMTDEENKKRTEDMLKVLRGINEENETVEQGEKKYFEHTKRAVIKRQK